MGNCYSINYNYYDDIVYSINFNELINDDYYYQYSINNEKNKLNLIKDEYYKHVLKLYKKLIVNKRKELNLNNYNEPYSRNNKNVLEYLKWLNSMEIEIKKKCYNNYLNLSNEEIKYLQTKKSFKNLTRDTFIKRYIIFKNIDENIQEYKKEKILDNIINNKK